jgi:hypothetical protein
MGRHMHAQHLNFVVFELKRPGRFASVFFVCGAAGVLRQQRKRHDGRKTQSQQESLS